MADSMSPDDADTIANRISQEMVARVAAAMAERWGNESELGAFELEAVRELGRKAI